MSIHKDTIRNRSTTRIKYTMLPNKLLNDPRLDWAELGLLAHLISKPDDWNVMPQQLADDRKSGRNTIYKLLKKLKDLGYAKYHRISTGGGYYDIYDCDTSESTENRPLDEIQQVGFEKLSTISEPLVKKPLVKKPLVGIYTLQRTDLLQRKEKETKGFAVTEKKTQHQQGANIKVFVENPNLAKNKSSTATSQQAIQTIKDNLNC